MSVLGIGVVIAIATGTLNCPAPSNKPVATVSTEEKISWYRDATIHLQCLDAEIQKACDTGIGELTIVQQARKNFLNANSLTAPITSCQRTSELSRQVRR